MSEISLWEKGVRKLPESHCLDCGYKMNAGGSISGDDALPGPNDVAICMKCGAVMRFGDDMRVRGMTDAEMDELTSDKAWMDEIAGVVQRVHMVRAAGN